MSTPTRGFTGRFHRSRDERLPPGQYDVGSDLPVLTAEVTPRLDPQRWTITVDGLVDAPTTWTWDEAHGCRRRSTTATSIASPPGPSSGPASAGSAWTPCSRRPGPLPEASYVLATSTDRLHHEPAAGRCHRRQGLGGVDARGQAAAGRPRRPGPPAGAASVLLEEREVGHPDHPAGSRSAGILGAQRLSRPGRSLARTAVPG